MSRVRFVLAAALLVGACRNTGDAGKAPPVAPDAHPAHAAPADHAVLARVFVELLGRREFDDALLRLAPEAKAGLTSAQLQQLWDAELGGLGPFASIAGETVLPDRVVVHARLAHGTIAVDLAFGTGGDRIAHFTVEPADSYEAPAYVDDARFEARDVAVGDGARALPGTLLVPTGAGPFPAVLLVGDEGPLDRDEASGGARPLRDLAEGLASRGVAVLRWEKRTFGAHLVAVHEKPDQLTISDEYLDDVAAAIALARATPGIDPARVWVLGHALGGWLAPRIIALHPELAGAIALGAPSRPPEDVFATDAAQAARVKSASLDEKTAPDLLPRGIPARWWLSLRGYDPLAGAKGPLLFLDQATEDLDGWRKAGAEVATFAAFYSKGHVDPEVVGDVASRIMR
jgi:hypothetical protein